MNVYFLPTLKFAYAAGAGAIALVAMLEPPPFGNVWFDMLSGAVSLYLWQCFAGSLEPPHEGSSDWYRSFYRFCNLASGLRSMLRRATDIVDRLKGKE